MFDFINCFDMGDLIMSIDEKALAIAVKKGGRYWQAAPYRSVIEAYEAAKASGQPVDIPGLVDMLQHRFGGHGDFYRQIIELIIPEIATPKRELVTLDADMPQQELLLHMGEMTAQEIRTARAAIRWANHVAKGKPPYTFTNEIEDQEGA